MKKKSSAAERTLPLFREATHSEKPAKKPTKKSVSKKRFPGGGFYGRTIPPLLGPDGRPYTCPCGRVRMMRNAEGGVFLFDSKGRLGECKIGTDYSGPIMKAIHRLQQVGCRFHPSVEPVEPGNYLEQG